MIPDASIPCRDLAAAVVESAIEDLSDRRRTVREDAREFILSDRLAVWLSDAGLNVDAEEVRTALRRRHLLPG